MKKRKHIKIKYDGLRPYVETTMRFKKYDAVVPAKFIYRDPASGEESPIRFMEPLDEEEEEKTIWAYLATIISTKSL